MGCGDSKVILFEGTPEEEVLHYAHSIILAARSGEKNKGPFMRVELALTQILAAVQKEDAKISPKAADKLAEAIESLRIEAAKIFEKKFNDINVVRIAVTPKISYGGDVGQESAEELPEEKIPNNYSKLQWIPRVVSVEQNDVNTLDSTIELGLCGASAQALGFCVEAWVLDTSAQRKGESSSSIKLLDCPSGEGRIAGQTPKCHVDKSGRIVLDFHKTAFNSGKHCLTEEQWNHVAFVYGRGEVKLYINGHSAKLSNSILNFPEGHAALCICTGGTGFVTEMRVWNSERTEEQILSTMSKAISPVEAKEFPSLRLSWLPLAREGYLNPSGSLLFDTWTRKPLGTRGSSPVLADTRWPCALPTVLMPKDNIFVLSHMEEYQEVWENQQMASVATQTFARYQPTLSVIEEKALQVVNLLMQKGGPWVPRVVSLPPGATASIGSTAELGLTAAEGFTIECWVRLRGEVSPAVENCILGVGYGEATGDREGLTVSLKGGRPCFGFTGHEIEAEAGIARMRWTHLSFVYDGTSMLKIYANGNLIKHGTCDPLLGNCCLTIGSSRNKNPLVGDLCEFRLWNRPLPAEEINNKMHIAIPPLGGKGFYNLRLLWLPLRSGGPVSREFWCRRQTVLQSLAAGHLKSGSTKGSTKSSTKGGSGRGTSVEAVDAIARPFPTLLWDVKKARDVGTLSNIAGLLTSRCRNLQIPAYIPPVQELPPAWSKSAAAIIDEWTDCLDRAFVPKWYVPPLLDSENVDDSLSSFPTSASEAAVKGGAWIARVMRPLLGVNYSTVFGKTQETGLLGVGTGGREFTVELWLRPRAIPGLASKSNKKDDIVFEDLLGHEDAKSNEATGFFGTGKPFALRLGLASNQPFISLVGPIKSLRQKDNSECVISSEKLLPGVWVHVAYVIQGDGKMVIFVDGIEMARAEKIGPLQAKGDTNVHLFGYEGRKWQTEICELRMWSVARKQKDVEESMFKSFAPQPTGHPQVKGIRFSWFPCNSSRSTLWDHKYINFRGIFPNEEGVQVPKWTRRPEFIPTKLKGEIKTIPSCFVLDDRGDSYERNYAPGIVPPVVRDEVGAIMYEYYDPSFVPLKKKGENGGFSGMLLSGEKEYNDVGWNDTDDGTFTLKNDQVIDDGGWYLGWGDVKEEIVEEIDHVVSLDHQNSTESGRMEGEGNAESKEEESADVRREDDTRTTDDPSVFTSTGGGGGESIGSKEEIEGIQEQVVGSEQEVKQEEESQEGPIA